MAYQTGRFFARNRGYYNTVLNWNGSAIHEFYKYADAFHRAAATLVEHVDLDRAAQADWDACPIIFLYRHALELIMKAIILGEGAKFLKPRPSDKPVPVTHSLPALLADVIRIVEQAGGPDQFVGGGSMSFKDNCLFVAELDELDPGSFAFRYPVKKDGDGSVPEHTTFSANAFVQDVEAVYDVPDTICFALPIICDQQQE
jgi:hypothetical protein